MSGSAHQDAAHQQAKHHEAKHHEAGHDTEHWLEKYWGFLVIALGLICVYFLDTFAPVI